MFERIHIIIPITAGLLFTVFSVIYDLPFNIFAWRLCIIICVFYTIGCIVKVYLKRNVFVNKSCYFLEEDVLPNPRPEKNKSSDDNTDDLEYEESDETGEELSAQDS